MRTSPLLALAALLAGAASAQSVPVPPSLETQAGATTAGGSLQDVAVWVNPADGGASLVFATYNNANSGLVTFGVDGRQLDQEPQTNTLGMAVQDGFPLAGGSRTVVLAASSSSGMLAYLVDPGGADLVRLIGNVSVTPVTAYSSLAPYRSPTSGRFYVFAGTAGGELRQLELTGADGGVTATLARDLGDVGAGVSGLVVDEELNSLYVVETGTALWRYAAEADGGTARQQVTSFPGGALSLSVNRLGLYRAANGEGYVIAANTGSDSFAVFERRSQAFVGSFNVTQDGGIDAVRTPVGLAVVSRPVGPAFPDGLFVAHDGDDSPQNLKLVSWPAVANAFNPPLRIDTRQGDGGTNGGADGGTDGGTTGPGGSPGGGNDFPIDRDDSGCSCASASVPATALFGLLALALARRRRR
jgi:3-phytase